MFREDSWIGFNDITNEGDIICSHEPGNPFLNFERNPENRVGNCGDIIVTYHHIKSYIQCCYSSRGTMMPTLRLLRQATGNGSREDLLNINRINSLQSVKEVSFILLVWLSLIINFLKCSTYQK